jgi:exonuclease SbcD
VKIIHTADWHLGRQFHNVSLLEDQEHVLKQIVSLAKEIEADVVIIAGDVYDRSVPPSDAVSLLDETLHHLTMSVDASVVLIAGNHDGAVRLAYGSRQMEKSRVFISGPLSKSVEPFVIQDEHGPVYFCPLPYADPAEVRIEFGEDEIRSHDAAVNAMAIQMRSHLPADARSIAIGHCWVEGGTNTESERPLTVGGTGQVTSGCFDGFHYTALGHLHRPQSVTDNIQYSGSLFKYSFSEVDHKKSVTVIDLGADGSIICERVNLNPKRDLRVIEGTMADVLKGPADGESTDDYLLVRLTDTGAILDAMGQLREVYPNVLHIERPGLQINDGLDATPEDHRGRSELDLFKDFYTQMKGSVLEEEQERVLAEVIDQLRNADREVLV